MFNICLVAFPPFILRAYNLNDMFKIYLVGSEYPLQFSLNFANLL